MQVKKKLLLDIAERVFWTFLQGAISALMLGPAFDLSTLEAAALGGVGAVLALVKGTAAAKVGSPVTAATLPKTVEVVTDLGGEVVGKVEEMVTDAAGDAMAILDEIEDSTLPKKES